MTFKPKHKRYYPIQTDQLTKFEANIFQELLREWTDTPTLDLLLKTGQFIVIKTSQ
jgi:hypothetical protein